MVTAILLLLSLPVLAGGNIFNLFIAPALNLAVCWNIFINFKSYSDNQQVMQQDSKPMQNSNDCAPENLSNFLFFFPFFEENGKKNAKETMLGSYLAGLIEGDGTIVVPQTERSPKGKLNYASLQVTFVAKDFPLASVLLKLVGHGSIHKKSQAAAYTYTINSIVGLVRIANLLNGRIRGPKAEDLKHLINYLNHKSKGLNLEIQGLDMSCISSNP